VIDLTINHAAAGRDSSADNEMLGSMSVHKCQEQKELDYRQPRVLVERLEETGTETGEELELGCDQGNRTRQQCMCMRCIRSMLSHIVEYHQSRKSSMEILFFAFINPLSCRQGSMTKKFRNRRVENRNKLKKRFICNPTKLSVVTKIFCFAHRHCSFI
jgi:hypothetical protein